MGRGEEPTGFRLGNLTDRQTDPGVDGSIMLKWVFKKRHRRMDCIDLAHERDRCWALVNGVMNLRVPINAGNFFTSWGPVNFSGRSLLHEIIIIIIIITTVIIILPSLDNF